MTQVTFDLIRILSRAFTIKLVNCLVKLIVFVREVCCLTS